MKQCAGLSFTQCTNTKGNMPFNASSFPSSGLKHRSYVENGSEWLWFVKSLFGHSVPFHPGTCEHTKKRTDRKWWGTKYLFLTWQMKTCSWSKTRSNSVPPIIAWWHSHPSGDWQNVRVLSLPAYRSFNGMGATEEASANANINHVGIYLHCANWRVFSVFPAVH